MHEFEKELQWSHGRTNHIVGRLSISYGMDAGERLTQSQPREQHHLNANGLTPTEPVHTQYPHSNEQAAYQLQCLYNGKQTCPYHNITASLSPRQQHAVTRVTFLRFRIVNVSTLSRIAATLLASRRLLYSQIYQETGNSGESRNFGLRLLGSMDEDIKIASLRKRR